MLKNYFVNQALKEVQIEEFIRKRFPEGDYSRMELQRTPLGIKIVIYSSSPGRIIGRGGRTINEMTDVLKEKFDLENPQLDVKSVANPNTDAKIVAKQVALALRRGFNAKRIGNTTLKRIMKGGAIGAEIIISGRISGGKSMSLKFIDGYLKHSGNPSKELVDYGLEEIYEVRNSKPGKIGIKVKIMNKFQTITGEIKTSLKDITPGRVTDKPAEEDEEAKQKKEKPKKGEAAGKEPKKEAKEKKPGKEPKEKKEKPMTAKPKAAKTKAVKPRKPAK